MSLPGAASRSPGTPRLAVWGLGHSGRPLHGWPFGAGPFGAGPLRLGRSGWPFGPGHFGWALPAGRTLGCLSWAGRQPPEHSLAGRLEGRQLPG